MNIALTFTLLILLLISIGINIKLYLSFRNKSAVSKTKSDLNLIADLCSNEGRTIIEIKRIAPSSMFVRSPRDIR